MKAKSLIRSLAFALVCCGAWQPLLAQFPDIEIGPRLGFDLAGDLQEFSIGLDGRVSIASLPVDFDGAYDYYFVEGDASFYQFSLNVLYPFSIPNPAISPYVGAGIGISHVSAGRQRFLGYAKGFTDTGLNLIGGFRIRAPRLQPFVQAQITVGDVDLFSVTGGLLFGI